MLCLTVRLELRTKAGHQKVQTRRAAVLSQISGEESGTVVLIEWIEELTCHNLMRHTHVLQQCSQQKEVLRCRTQGCEL